MHISQKRLRVLVATLALAVTAVLGASPAAASPALTNLASHVPAAWTPHIVDTDGTTAIRETTADMAQAGKHMFYSGKIPKAQNPARTSTFTCGGLIWQNLATQATSCPVRFNGDVEALLVSSDGMSLFAGGSFTSVTAGGITHSRKSLAKIDIATKTVVTGFDAKISSGKVSDLQLAAGHLVVAGTFTKLGGVTRTMLASVSQTSGVPDSFINLSISGSVADNAGPVQVYRVAVHPQGTRVVIIGNFLNVGGVHRARAAMLLLGTTATVSGWWAPVLDQPCGTKMMDYMRDVAFSPTGHEFTFGTTGGLYVYPRLCDSVSMWPTNDNPKATPRWIDYGPKDTIHSVIHTGTYVYAGGHQRGHNTNLFRNGVRINTPAIKTSGIGVLRASDGVALNWAAGRDRGEGAKKLLAVQADAYHPAGVFVGSDTYWWYRPDWRKFTEGNQQRLYYRGGIAFLPA